MTDIEAATQSNLRLGVVTPTFNRPEMLVRLYRSLVTTGKEVDWIHLVADDFSSEDYRPAIAECRELNDAIDYFRVSKGGPLAARNNALDRAARRACSHVVFIDDDDYLVEGGLDEIASAIRENPKSRWFVFPAMGKLNSENWPDFAATMSWFHDVVYDQRLGSDNLLVVSMDLIGKTRFPANGRNQREWKFLLELSRKDDRILAVPKTLMAKVYQPDGLSATTRVKYSGPEAIFNNLERAWRYWICQPFSKRLIGNLGKQLVATPFRLVIYLIMTVAAETKSRGSGTSQY